MDESDGTHGPVDEGVIASLFEKHHGPKVYTIRQGNLPEWYTKGFKYFYFIYEGKILSVLGYSNWGNYNVLGGGFTHRPWKQETNYFGSPIEKVMIARQPYITGKPAIAGFSDSPGWQKRMVEAGWEMEPIDTYGIDLEMVDNFREHYGEQSNKTWGIRVQEYDIERMAKAYEDFNSSWWIVLKLQRHANPELQQIPVIKPEFDNTIDFELPERVERKKTPEECCELFRPHFRQWAERWWVKASWDSFDNKDCEYLYQAAENIIKYNLRGLGTSSLASNTWGITQYIAARQMQYIKDQWDLCESGKEYKIEGVYGE